jgi:alginate O-acetyltransferase complex protein AlgI
MLLGGLWHGASWNFVIWGALHGGFLVIERLVRDATAGNARFKSSFAQLFGRLGTFALVCIAWVYFRAADLPTAWRINRAMFGFGGAEGARGDEYVAAVVVALLVATHIVGRDSSWEDIARKIPMPVAALSLAVMLLFILSSAGGRAFVYFQF